jgi:hypothetical protein
VRIVWLLAKGFGLLAFVALTAPLLKLLEPMARASYDEYDELWSNPDWDDPGIDVDEEEP